MGSIKSALDALDKATPGPWKGTECLPYQCVINGLYPVAETTGPDDYVVANLALIAAAPDMAAWIKDAILVLADCKAYMESFSLDETARQIDALLSRVKE